LKLPLAVILLLGVTVAVSRPWLRERPLDETALWLAPAVVLLFFSFACTAQLGVRYVLPMLPFLHVAIGKVAAHVPAWRPRLYRVTVGGLVAWAALSVLSFHPHYLSYFNGAIGTPGTCTSTWPTPTSTGGRTTTTWNATWPQTGSVPSRSTRSHRSPAGSSREAGG